MTTSHLAEPHWHCTSMLIMHANIPV